MSELRPIDPSALAAYTQKHEHAYEQIGQQLAVYHKALKAEYRNPSLDTARKVISQRARLCERQTEFAITNFYDPRREAPDLAKSVKHAVFCSLDTRQKFVEDKTGLMFDPEALLDGPYNWAMQEIRGIEGIDEAALFKATHGIISKLNEPIFALEDQGSSTYKPLHVRALEAIVSIR